MNKYQEALDNLKTHLEYGFPEDDELMCERCLEEVDTLQQSINDLERLMAIENKYLSMQKECNDWYCTVENYRSKLELYKKALDKACEELDDKYYCHRGTKITCDDNNCIMCIKEHLLKESEKQ